MGTKAAMGEGYSGLWILCRALRDLVMIWERVVLPVAARTMVGE